MKSNMAWTWYFKWGRFTIGWLRIKRILNDKVVTIQPIKWEIRDCPESKVKVYQFGKFKIVKDYS